MDTGSEEMPVSETIPNATLAAEVVPDRSAVTAVRRAVLAELQGPEYRAIHEIPRRWPVLRQHISAVVAGLVEEGFVERGASPRSAGMVPVYRATENGRRELTVDGAGGRRDPAWRSGSDERP